jgi:Zn ribbon nucleic-acid-binding protein
MKYPRFFKTVLVEITEDVMDVAYPKLKGKNQLSLTERMGSEFAVCPDCGKNKWMLLPKESVAVKEGGKPYIECLSCGYQTHL